MEIWEHPAWPRFWHDSARTETLLAEFSARLGAVEGLHAALSADERREALLRAVTREALSSFAIEGATLPRDQIEASVIASLAHRGAEPQRRSDAIAELMLDARSGGAGTMTAARLHHWHRMLFHGIEIEDKGRWRSFPMVITRSARAGPDDVLYHAPPAGAVPEMMAQFLGALTHDIRPLPIRAALAHLWFESIHPFSDGNGRLGRALVEYVFAQSAPLPFSLSRQIEADKRGYYAALQAGRRIDGDRIDATTFVLWFLERLIAGVEDAAQDARFLVTRNAFFLRHAPLPARAEKVLRRLFAQGPERVAQGLSAAPYARIAKVSPATATRDLTHLETQGVLRRGPAGGRSTRYLLELDSD